MTTETHGEDPRLQSARARLGTVLQDKWRLEALLGVGGMAAVYAAVHRNGKRVAVKMLHPEYSHEAEVRKRFLQEGYAANTIQHDGAVSVLDDDLAPDGSAFIVMELLEGETVDQRWERRGQKLPMRDVLAIADQLLDVLAAAHAKNIVHRDVKPENLFLTKNGALKVLDFGIAKVFERQQTAETSTRAGTIMGTPAFMAPEQALAHWDEVDARTDLWAVGATMFTLLSGRHVHEAPSSHEQLIVSATAQAPELRSVVPEIPPTVASVVDRALAFDKRSRWDDARTMQQALRAAAAGLSGAMVAPRLEPGTAFMVGPGGRLDQQPAAQPIAATMLDTMGASTAAAWKKEREAHAAEAARLRGTVSDLQQRLGLAKKRSADAQATLETARAERISLERWFKRQVGTRTAAVAEAQEHVRLQMVALAKSAIADRSAFGTELDAAREQIGKLERASEAAARDVGLHVAALDAYDGPSLRGGVVLLGVAAVLALALLVAPIVWRATRVVEPPLPTTSHPVRR